MSDFSLFFQFFLLKFLHIANLNHLTYIENKSDLGIQESNPTSLRGSPVHDPFSHTITQTLLALYTMSSGRDARGVTSAS